MNPPSIRPPAVAGRFYPGTAGEIERELDRCFANAAAEPDKTPARAVMLPHAGWIFCGDIIAETIARTTIPPVAVVIGPKHTRYGSNWSVSSDEEWRLPNATIPVATEWVECLTGRVASLDCERDAHRAEHGCEVLLPFLHRVRPDIRVVPIAIGAAEFDSLGELAAGLAELPDDVLLVISSDMNHFAGDAENRRRDDLALQQLLAGDPRGLYDVCLENDISMCGMRPAVAVLGTLGECEVEITRYETSARVTNDLSIVVGYAGALIR